MFYARISPWKGQQLQLGRKYMTIMCWRWKRSQGLLWIFCGLLLQCNGAFTSTSSPYPPHTQLRTVNSGQARIYPLKMPMSPLVSFSSHRISEIWGNSRSRAEYCRILDKTGESNNNQGGINTVRTWCDINLNDQKLSFVLLDLDYKIRYSLPMLFWNLWTYMLLSLRIFDISLQRLRFKWTFYASRQNLKLV